MKVVRTEKQVQDMLSWSENKIFNGETDHEDGTYESGVRDAICWLLGLTETPPSE